MVEVRASVAAAALGLGGESQGVWSKVVRTAGATSPILRAVLTNASLESVKGDSAVVACAPRFMAGARKMQGAIAEALSRELGRVVSVDLREVGEAGGEVLTGARQSSAGEAPGAVGGAAASPEAPATPASAEAAPKAVFNPNQALEHALVKQAMELFGARVVDVKPR